MSDATNELMGHSKQDEAVLWRHVGRSGEPRCM
jgi:hypothetical protein